MTPRAHSPKGDGPKAAYGTLVGICRLRRGFLFPEGWMLVAVGTVPPGRGARGRFMTQDERRNPSRHRIEEHDMLNWLKANRKVLNAGRMKEPRLGMFKRLLEMGEEVKRVNQWG